MESDLDIDIAVLCDVAGVVRYVICDHLSEGSSLQGCSLAEALNWAEPSRFVAFLEALHEEGLVSGWTLRLLQEGDRPRTLHFVGEQVGEVILIIGADSPTRLGSASRALLSSTVVPLSVLFSTAGAGSTPRLRGWNHIFYADLSRVNNELINARRELSKRNAQLASVNDDLRSLNACLKQVVKDRRRVEEDPRDSERRFRLEALVNQRTVELTRANERLRDEIVRRQQAEKILQRYTYELELLNLAGQALTSSLDMDNVLATVLQEVRHLLDVAAASVWLRDLKTGEAICRQAHGTRHDRVRGVRLAPGQGIVGWVIQHNSSLIVPDVREDPRYFPGVDRMTGLGLRSLLTVPLQVGAEVIGVLQVVDTEVGAFGPEDLRLIESLAAFAAIGIENARLFERSQQQNVERRRAEEALRRSQENYASLVNSIDGIVWEADPQTFQFTFVSEQAERLLGYPVERWTREPNFWEEHLHPDDREWAPTFCRQMTAAGRGHEFEYRMLTADGKTLWLRDFVAVELEEGKPVRLRGIMVDTTAQKEANEALLRSEQKFRSVVESSYDGVVLVDERGDVVVWNAGQERITGIKRSEALSFPIWEVQFRLGLPEQRRPSSAQEILRQQVLQCLESGAAPWLNKIMEYEIERPDGGRRLTESLTFSIPTEEGFMIGSVTRDVTERRQKERALHRYTQRLRALSTQLAEAEEAERKRLARELHDRVGQNLTALGINLNIVQSMIPDHAPASIRSRLMDSLALVEETTERIRNVMAELRPPVLDDYGLIATLHWHAEQFSARTGIPVTVEAEDLGFRLPPRMEEALFRIVQEALNNVAKHAEATHAEVRVKLQDGRICLIVLDDGRGFDPEGLSAPMEERGWGLITMAERAEALGGSFHLESSPGAGTRVIVEVER
ncbi:MAG: GAF domain-containing protein [Anaerolineae bacterium]